MHLSLLCCISHSPHFVSITVGGILYKVLWVFVLKSYTGGICDHRRSSSMDKRLAPSRNTTNFCGTSISPVVLYSKIHILVCGPQCCESLVASLLKKQLKTGKKKSITCLIISVEWIQGCIAFTTLCFKFLYQSNTQFCHVLSTHSFELGRKLLLEINIWTLEVTVNILSIVHSSFVWNCAHLNDFHCLFISFRKEVNLVKSWKVTVKWYLGKSVNVFK